MLGSFVRNEATLGYLSPDPVAAGHVHELHWGLVVHGEGEGVVLHAGVGLPRAARHQLAQDRRLAAVADPSNQNLCNIDGDSREHITSHNGVLVKDVKSVIDFTVIYF